MEKRFFEFKWLAACAALASGEACGFAAAAYAPCWPAVAAAAGLSALFGYGSAVRGWLWPVVFLAGFALAGRVAAEERRVLDGAVTLSCGRPYVCEVAVEGPAERRPGRDGRDRWVFPGAIGPVKVRIVASGFGSDGTPRAGETWACAGWLARRPPERGARRFFWIAGKGSFARRVGARGRLADVLDRFRSDCSRRVGIGLEHDRTAADLNRAMLLGERARIDPRVRDCFVAAGTVHLFAISGLHVMVVARAMLFVLVLAFVPVRVAQVAVLPPLWIYVLLVGAPPSAVRAAAMASFHLVAPACWRRPDAVRSWALTFLLVYGSDPGKLADAGCGLSFAVMLALVLWGRWVVRSGLSDRWAKVGVTAVAWAAGVPIAARVFGRVTPGGLVANLVAVPAAVGSVVGGLLGVLSSYLSLRLAAHVNNLAALFTRFTAGLSRSVAGLPGANFQVEQWNLAECVSWYVALLLLFLVLVRWQARRL